MAIGYTELDFINGTAPALNAANMNHIDEGVKACADALDLETVAGKAMTQAANAAAQRTLLNVEDGADVTDEANVTAAAAGTAEVTAAPDHILVLVGGALKRWTKAGFEAVVKALFPATVEAGTGTATPNDTDVLAGVKADHTSLKYTWANLKAAILTAIGKTNLATGFTLAGGTTPKTLTVSADADTVNVPTANEKTRLSDIQAATGATTALKLANLASPATNAQQGVALLGASGGAAKLTKMPDGATAVYSQDVWATIDGWARNSGSGTVGVSGGRLTVEAACNGIFKSIAGCAGKTLYIKMAAATAGNFTFALGGNPGATIAIPASTVDSVYKIQLPAIAVSDFIGIAVTGVAFSVDSIWIGDYSYAVGSLSEEAARIADQLGDTPGVGAAATATITSNGTNVNTPSSGTLTTTASVPADGSTFKVGTKTYTWKATALTPTEGEVLLEATVAACLTNARDAVNGTAGTLGTKHQCTANALFTATASATILTVTAILRGTVGNGATYEIVAGAGSELTASGALATGGVDDTVTIGGKVYTIVGVLATGPTVEGQVLCGSSNAVTHTSLMYAINGIIDAARHSCAAANPLVSDVYAANVHTLSARSTGILGNQITIAKSASATTLTLSGTTLTGGKDDVGDKIHTQLQTMPASTAKYGATLLAADGGTTAGTVVQANDSRIGSAANLSWTPVPKFGGVNDDGTFAITNNRYRKVAANVYEGECMIAWSAKGTKTGDFTVGGIPVNQASLSTAFAMGNIHISNMVGLTAGGSIYLTSEETPTVFYINKLTTTGSAHLTDANFANNTTIRIRWRFISA